MAARCFPAAAPRGAGSSPSATREPYATPRTNPAGAEGTGFVFPKSRRLRKQADYRRVYDQGARVNSPFFSAICFCRPEAGASRVGFSVSKRLGKAVVRNRIRRRLREAARLEWGWLPPRWDIVFRARQAAVDAPVGRLRQEVRRIFTRCKGS